jgi:hypothetical protein
MLPSAARPVPSAATQARHESRQRFSMIDPASSQPQHRLAGLSGRHVAWIFLAFALVASVPIVSHPLPPLLDYPNHLARMHVIAAIGRDADLSRFYEIEWQIIPNLMMDMIVPLLQPAFGLYRAGQGFMLITIALIMSGVLALNRAMFGKWSLLPLAAAPLLYNGIFILGLMNYMFGIGLAIWGLAVWIWLRERALPQRLAASALVGLALFFCHLFAVGIYGLGLLAIESWRLWTKRDRPLAARIAEFLAAGLPFVPVLALLLLSPTWGLSGENHWDEEGKLDGLLAVIETYSDAVDWTLLAIAAAAVAWAVRRRALRLHPIGWIILALGGIVYLAMPTILFSTYLADQRLPIALVFMIMSFAQLELRSRAQQAVLLGLLGFLLIVRIAEVSLTWTDLSRDTLALRDSVKRIEPRGSRVLVAQADARDDDEARDYGLAHAACLAVIERSALVSTVFTEAGKQIIHARLPYRNQVETGDGDLPSIEQLQSAAERVSSPAAGDSPPYWELWQDRFDYVYVVFTERDAANPMPELLTLVDEGDRFQLYKVKKPDAAGRPPGGHAVSSNR